MLFDVACYNGTLRSARVSGERRGLGMVVGVCGDKGQCDRSFEYLSFNLSISNMCNGLSRTFILTMATILISFISTDIRKCGSASNTQDPHVL